MQDLSNEDLEMSEYFSSQSRFELPFEPANRARILDSIRWVEVAALCLSGLVAGASFHFGIFLALPLLASAAIMVPRDRIAAEERRAGARAALVDGLRQDGYHLRSSYMAARAQPLSKERALVLADARRGVAAWIVSTTRSIERYPEFAGIFKTHRSSCGIIAELDSCLQRLSELRELGLLSDRLELPI